MPIHGLKVELIDNKMAPTTFDEKAGMIEFYKRYIANYDAYDEQGLIDYVIVSLIDDPNYRVTYVGEAGGATNVVKDGGGKPDPKIKGLKDKGSEKKFNMVVPSEKPDSTALYVQNIITNVNGLNSPENQMYLLGVILMRKCR